jgi:hypothetical protein
MGFRGRTRRKGKNLVSPSLGIEGQHMLKPCTAPGCTTIIFGTGTCTEHDGWNEAVEETQLAFSEADAWNYTPEHST